MEKAVKLAGVVILNEQGELCLLRHMGHDHLQFPGGKVEDSDKTAEAAAQREAQEELGCLIVIVRTLLENELFEHNGRQFIQDLFLAEIPKGQSPRIAEPDIFDELIWLKITDFKSATHKLAPNVRAFLAAYSQGQFDFREESRLT